MIPTFEQFNAFAASLTPRIREVIHQYVGVATVDYKADDSPVTIADREVEAYIVDRIEETFPGSTIVGEESGVHCSSAGSEGPLVEWIIDPIDGTKSFIHGVPLFATLLGVMVDGEPRYGAIYNPLLDDMVTGDGVVALWNGRPVRMRPCASLDKALLLTTDISDIARYRTIEGFNSLVEKCWLLRTWGDAFGYALLATGRGDVMVDPIMSRWDLAALIPVIRGAGGVITDYYGGDPATGDSIVAAAPELHTEVLGILNSR